MWLHKLVLLALVTGSLCQQQQPEGGVRRLKFRFQRPRVVGVDNEEGVQVGRPVPLSNADSTAHFLEQAFVPEELPPPQQDPRFAPRPAAGGSRRQQANDALQTLLATAQRGEEQSPLDSFEQFDDGLGGPVGPAPVQQQQPQSQRLTPRRNPPGVPRRRVPRPQTAQPEDLPERRRPRPVSSLDNRPEEPPIQTVERYSHENEDGSFTFGYISDDGSFREETRGADCITRGKYGYVDPDGMRREFTYVSGLPCEVGEDGLGGFSEDEEDLQTVEDPINPAERFRTATAVQVSEEELQSLSRPRQRLRQPIRGGQSQLDLDLLGQFPQQQQQQQQPSRQRIRDPAVDNRRPRPQLNAQPSAAADRRPRPNAQPSVDTRRQRPQLNAQSSAGRRPQLNAQPTRGGQDSSALNQLLNFAGNQEQQQLQPTPLPARRPPPTPTQAARPRPTPTAARARPTPTAAAARPRPNAGGFDFDQELSSFSRNRPALTFDDGAGRRPAAPGAQQVGPNFSSELVFDPASGTFNTELRQNVGQTVLRQSQQNVPGARAPPTPQQSVPALRPAQPTPTAARRPPPTPTAARRPPPTPTALRAFPNTPRSSQSGNNPSVGGLQFEPLDFPDPASVRIPSPTPAPRARPTPTQARLPPTPTQARLPPTPTPQRRLPPTPTPQRRLPPTPTPQRLPTPTPQRAFPTPTPQRLPSPTPQRGVLTPTAQAALATPVPARRPPPNPLPQRFPAPGSPAPGPTPGPESFFFQPFPTGTPRPNGPVARLPPQPAAPQNVQPAGTLNLANQGRPSPTPGQLQFGFTPVRSGPPQRQPAQQGGGPFTAFSTGVPPQLRGVPPPGPLQQQRPGPPGPPQGLPLRQAGPPRPPQGPLGVNPAALLQQQAAAAGRQPQFRLPTGQQPFLPPPGSIPQGVRPPQGARPPLGLPPPGFRPPPGAPQGISVFNPQALRPSN